MGFRGILGRSRRQGYQKSPEAVQKEEMGFKEDHGIPVDAYGLPEIAALYEQTMKDIWPRLCKANKAQSRYLKTIHEALKNVDKKFADIYIVEPDIDFSTSLPCGSAKIYAYTSKLEKKAETEEEASKQETLKQQEMNNISNLGKAMLLTYESLMKDYVLADKSIDEGTIRTVYNTMRIRIEKEAKKQEVERNQKIHNDVSV